jgi:hypothetical protein
MAATATKVRKANVQPNHLPASVALSVVLDGTTIGAIGIEQGQTLSEKGNVVYAAGIKKGLRLPGDNVSTTLKALTFEIDETALNAGEVHLSAPRVSKSGRSSGGGNLTVCHTATIKLTDEVSYTFQVFCTYLGEEKGYNLSIKGFPRPVNTGGPQVVGEVVGLTIS